MTDIFREVEEEVRRERFEQLWKKYGDYIIAAAALIVVAVAAFELWRIYEKREALRASQVFNIAQQMLEQGQPKSAALTFSKLADTAPSGYSQIAMLDKANALYASGSVPQAVDIYKQVAAKGDALLAPVARVRAAWASVDTAPRADVEALLQPLLDPATAWHPVAREILAYADYRAGDSERALSEFRAIANDPNSPETVRQRCKAMATFISAGGNANFGSVPAPAKAAPAQGAKSQ